MARLFADKDGKILRFLRTPEEEARYPQAPSGTASQILFDVDTNPEIAAALDSDFNNCSLSGTIFVYNGTPMARNPAGQAMTDRQGFAAIRTKLANDEQLTSSELNLVLRYLIRAARS
jgi:hypothetical protein